jgi:hypothetical protein
VLKGAGVPDAPTGVLPNSGDLPHSGGTT